MSIFGAVFAIATLLIAMVIIYEVLTKNQKPQDSLKVFIEADWSARLAELGVVSDTLFEKIGLAIKS